MHGITVHSRRTVETGQELRTAKICHYRITNLRYVWTADCKLNQNHFFVCVCVRVSVSAMYSRVDGAFQNSIIMITRQALQRCGMQYAENATAVTGLVLRYWTSDAIYHHFATTLLPGAPANIVQTES